MTFYWVQPDLKTQSYVLEDEQGATVAQLTFKPLPGVVWNAKNPQTAEGRAGTDRWTFSIQRSGVSGFLGLSSTVKIDGPHGGELSAGANFVSGKATLAGRDVEWHSSATRPGGARFTATDGTILVHFAPGAIQDRRNATVDIEPLHVKGSDGWLLSMLGLYLRIVGRRPFR